ncbi:hypothetical protein CDL15_Pgr026992 [Punica granatum]|uniref:Uncharacterized protein n=1 Tax=Punica granatum TaxID=22663 RepID=A0A218W7J9_PUNGR|nr:hypothetical protein CDL15_Pgr026992 [Punica granatum]PKI75204.1 hypothetical protein CRG98_004428 [Punica granatum]
MEQRMDRMVEQFTQQMAALLENQNRRNPNLSSNPDREEIEYDSNSEEDATLFSEEDPSDEAFFVAGGDGEPKFDEEEETVTGIGIGAAVTITKSIKELRDLGECLLNLDSGNLDCTRSGPRSAFDSNVVYQFEMMEYILDFDFDGHGENHAANFISRLLGRILSTHERMMRQTTWQVGTWRKIGSDDPISKETASKAKLTHLAVKRRDFGRIRSFMASNGHFYVI